MPMTLPYMNGDPMSIPATINFPDTIKSHLPAKFLWRDNQGQKWPPELMETRHLFNSLRMIWNHRMPEAARLHPYREYATLNRSDDYLKDAVLALAKELSTRKDLTKKWKADLRHMINWLSTHQLENLHDKLPTR